MKSCFFKHLKIWKSPWATCNEISFRRKWSTRCEYFSSSTSWDKQHIAIKYLLRVSNISLLTQEEYHVGYTLFIQKIRTRGKKIVLGSKTIQNDSILPAVQNIFIFSYLQQYKITCRRDFFLLGTMLSSTNFYLIVFHFHKWNFTDPPAFQIHNPMHPPISRLCSTISKILSI